MSLCRRSPNQSLFFRFHRFFFKKCFYFVQPLFHIAILSVQRASLPPKFRNSFVRAHFFNYKFSIFFLFFFFFFGESNAAQSTRRKGFVALSLRVERNKRKDVWWWRSRNADYGYVILVIQNNVDFGQVAIRETVKIDNIF